jgi:hypothetical protein
MKVLRSINIFKDAGYGASKKPNLNEGMVYYSPFVEEGTLKYSPIYKGHYYKVHIKGLCSKIFLRKHLTRKDLYKKVKNLTVKNLQFKIINGFLNSKKPSDITATNIYDSSISLDNGTIVVYLKDLNRNFIKCLTENIKKQGHTSKNFSWLPVLMDLEEQYKDIEVEFNKSEGILKAAASSAKIHPGNYSGTSSKKAWYPYHFNFKKL